MISYAHATDALLSISRADLDRCISRRFYRSALIWRVESETTLCLFIVKSREGGDYAFGLLSAGTRDDPGIAGPRSAPEQMGTGRVAYPPAHFWHLTCCRSSSLGVRSSRSFSKRHRTARHSQYTQTREPPPPQQREYFRRESTSSCLFPIRPSDCACDPISHPLLQSFGSSLRLQFFVRPSVQQPYSSFLNVSSVNFSASPTSPAFLPGSGTTSFGPSPPVGSSGRAV